MESGIVPGVTYTGSETYLIMRVTQALLDDKTERIIIKRVRWENKWQAMFYDSLFETKTGEEEQ